MLIVIVEVDIKHESVADTVAALETDRKAALAMPGCLAFRSCAINDAPAKIVLVEEWENAASFAAYKDSPAFTEAMATIKPVMTGIPTSRAFTAELVEKP